MALSINALTGSYTDSSSGLDAFTTASVSPTAGRVVVIDIYNIAATPANASAPATVSGAGLTFTKLTERNDATAGDNISRWYATSGSPSSGAISIGFTATQWRYLCQWSVYELVNADATGTNGANAFVQSANNAAVSTAVTVTLSAFSNANNGAIGCAAWIELVGAAATHTPDSGWSEVHEVGTSGFLSGAASATLATQFRASNDTSSVQTFSTSGGIKALASEIKEYVAPSLIPRMTLLGAG